MTAKTIIHVNSHTIRRNHKTGERKPPITVRQGRRGKPRYAHEIAFDGWRVVYRPDKPLPCGAVVWIEADAPRGAYQAYQVLE